MQARMSLHSEAGVKEATTHVACMSARLHVNRQQVLAVHGFRFESSATYFAHERPAGTVNRHMIRQVTLNTHKHTQSQPVLQLQEGP